MILEMMTALTIGLSPAPCVLQDQVAFATHQGVVCLSSAFTRFIEQTAPCESSYGKVMHPGRAVGDQGQSKGVMQIHGPSWQIKMVKMGLDFEDERDRLRMGQWIFENVGPGQWSCWKEE